MIEIDESALIEFFGVSPKPQTQEERDFFAAPLFIKQVAGLELRLSISAHARDLRATVSQAGCATPAVELVVPHVVAVSIEHAARRPWLRVTSETHGIVHVSVEPTITVISDGSLTA